MLALAVVFVAVVAVADGADTEAEAATKVDLTLESKEGKMPCSGSSSYSSGGKVVNVTVGRTFELALALVMDELRGVGPAPGAWEVLILAVVLPIAYRDSCYTRWRTSEEVRRVMMMEKQVEVGGQS